MENSRKSSRQIWTSDERRLSEKLVVHHRSARAHRLPHLITCGRSLWSSRTPARPSAYICHDNQVVALGPMLSTLDALFLEKFAFGRVAIAHHGPRDVPAWCPVGVLCAAIRA